MKKYALCMLFLSAALFSLGACSGGGQTSGDSTEGTTEFAANHGQSGVVDDVSAQNILQIAIGSPDHTTLVAAVKAAALENVLVNPGPLTVFAPNDEAFAKLPAGTVETLLEPENKSKLASIVTSHASPGTFKGADLAHGSQIYLATGQYVDVEVKDGDTYVYGAKILATVDASNGVVHVVDQVFLFPEE
jgi:uncharacterized surface protein with fasciclin (FAS1) repeats